MKVAVKKDPELVSPSFKTNESPLWPVCLVGFCLMEQEKTLQTLIEKAWALQDKIIDEIQYSCNGLGGFCPQHGLYFGFAEDPFAQRKSWIAIREALQVLENLLLSLQVGGFFASPFLGFV